MIIRLANWALMRVLPRDEASETIRDDLTEEFRALQGPGARWWGSSWYLWEAVKLCGHFVLLRLRHRGEPRSVVAVSFQANGAVGMGWDSMVQNVRSALRAMRRNPGFTAVVVLTSGIGIGAATATFSAVDGVVLRPLPFDEPEALVHVGMSQIGFDTPTPSSLPDFIDWTDRLTSLESLSAVQSTSVIVAGEESTERIPVAEVSPNFLAVLRVAPTLGRPFSEEDHVTGAPPVVLLSHAAWVRRYGADPAVLGRVLRTVDGSGGELRNRTIIGVLPEGVTLPPTLGSTPELWTPGAVDAEAYASGRGSRTANVLGRLRADRTLESAQLEADATAAEAAVLYPDFYNNEGHLHGIAITPLHERILGDTTTTLMIFWAATALLHLIGAVNVANLLLARAITRGSEVSLRSALGASRRQVFGLIMTETFALSIIGGLVGAALAYGAVAALRSLGADILPLVSNVQVDLRALGFALGLAVLTGSLFGLAPAFLATKAGASSVLHMGSPRSGTSRRQVTSRSALLALQSAIAVVLLCGSGLLVGTHLKLRAQEVGFEPDDLAIVSVGVSAGYATRATRTGFFRQFLSRVSSLPGVESVSMIQDPPLGFYGWWTPDVHTETQVRDIPAKILNHTVAADYLRTVGIPLKSGRGITAADAGGPPVTVLSETAAETLWPSQDPIGKRLRINNDPQVFTVVGVAGDVRQEALDTPMRGEMYTQYDVFPYWPNMDIMVRMAPGLEIPIAAMREELAQLDANLPLGRVTLANERVSEALAASRFNAWLLGAFAWIAVLLSMAGIYGTLQYMVSERRRELGVRIALGASSKEVLSGVLQRGLIPTGTGMTLGLLASVGLSKVMQSLLYGGSAVDLRTFTIAAVGFSLAATLACLVPAHRANKVDPVVSLRAE